jgi:hypothetical protein
MTLCAAGLAITAAPVSAGSSAAGVVAFAAEPTHELLLTSGKTVKVEIIEESSSEIKTKLYIGTMSAEKTYPRSEIITITEIGHSPEADSSMEIAAEVAVEVDEDMPANAMRVYVMELNGRLGWDISKTPVENAVEKAREMQADVIVVKCNNNWKQLEGFTDERTDDMGDFEEYRVSEGIQPVFSSEMRAKWDNEPKVVFWVERAMSGMAFLPLIKSDIYFTSDGRLGGVGDLDELFGSTGDEVVRDKQKSLRLSYVEGMAIEGGHDAKLVRAMTKKSYVLSYRIENGEPVYLEGEAPGGWILLTDDGKDENQDTDRDIVRNLGNDALTFDSDLAYKLQLSKGTADTLDDLFFEMGIEDRAVVIGDEDDDGETDAARYELDKWSDGITRALQRLRRVQFDLANVEVREQRNDPDGSKARNAARGQRIRILNQGIALLNKYGEVLDPGEQTRVGFELQKQQIENEKRLENINRRGPG